MMPNQKKLSKGDEKQQPKSTNQGQAQNKKTDDVCSICLEVCADKCFGNCRHFFCLKCLQEWSKHKPECPLCKTRFDTIFYGESSPSGYKEWKVPVQEAQFRDSSDDDYYFEDDNEDYYYHYTFLRSIYDNNNELEGNEDDEYERLLQSEDSEDHSWQQIDASESEEDVNEYESDNDGIQGVFIDYFQQSPFSTSLEGIQPIGNIVLGRNLSQSDDGDDNDDDDNDEDDQDEDEDDVQDLAYPLLSRLQDINCPDICAEVNMGGNISSESEVDNLRLGVQSSTESESENEPILTSEDSLPIPPTDLKRKRIQLTPSPSYLTAFSSTPSSPSSSSSSSYNPSPAYSSSSSTSECRQRRTTKRRRR